MRKFPYVQFEVWWHFLILSKKKYFLLKMLFGYSLVFLDNYLLIRPGNLKLSLNIEPQTFVREKVSAFAVP